MFRVSRLPRIPDYRKALTEKAWEDGVQGLGFQGLGNVGPITLTHYCDWFYFRANRAYWENLKPASGRPCCSSFSGPGGHRK